MVRRASCLSDPMAVDGPREAHQHLATLASAEHEWGKWETKNGARLVESRGPHVEAQSREEEKNKQIIFRRGGEKRQKYRVV